MSVIVKVLVIVIVAVVTSWNDVLSLEESMKETRPAADPSENLPSKNECENDKFSPEPLKQIYYHHFCHYCFQFNCKISVSTIGYIFC